MRHQEIVSYSLNIHKVLVSISYGRIPEVALEGNRLMVIVFLADLVFYADYYDLLETVRRQVERWAMLIHHLLQDIRAEPVFWVGLGRLLRSKDIFCHAMKHMVGNPDWDLWQTLHRPEASGHQNCPFLYTERNHEFPDDVFKVAQVIENDLKWYKTSLTKAMLQVINNLNGDLLFFDKPDDLPEAAVCQSVYRMIRIQQLVIGVLS
jgi:hypothetical protein